MTLFPRTKIKVPIPWKATVRALPLGGIVAASVLPVQAFVRQLLVLALLLWLQVYLLIDGNLFKGSKK